MAVKKLVKCDCGFVARSDNEDKLVAEVQKHAREQHQINASREQVLAMAQPDPGR
jgi:predicted small metal-binding protein